MVCWSAEIRRDMKCAEDGDWVCRSEKEGAGRAGQAEGPVGKDIWEEVSKATPAPPTLGCWWIGHHWEKT